MTVSPQVWTNSELASDRVIAIQDFVQERTTEPLGVYFDFYDSAYAEFATVLEISNNLTELRECAAELILDENRQEVCRYIASPPLSADDLKTTAQVTSLANGPLRSNPADQEKIINTILLGLDDRRFPWVSEGRAPSDEEREAALVATAAMRAMRQLETYRRGRGRALEMSVLRFLAAECGFTEVKAPKHISNSSQGPNKGEFCKETPVVGGKADIIVRLHDGRLVLIECKVSNSEVNSYKRLIHDCGEKAQAWVKELGSANCIPVAILSGVYSEGNLAKAQRMGLALVWAHNLAPIRDLTEATQ